MKFNNYIITLLLFFYSIHLCADTITITNKTDKNVYAAFYYTKGVTCELIKNIDMLKIPAGQSIQIERPASKLYLGGTYDRDLYFSYNQHDFPETFQKGARHFVNLGITRGNNFYIAENERNELDGYNRVTWAARPALKLVEDVAYAANRNTFLQAPYANTRATVRRGNNLSAKEAEYIQKRISGTQAAVSKLVGGEIAPQFTPRIAFCCSGGGYRAMISTAGFLKGAEKIGLLDATLYHAGLSGSTWAMATWLQSGKSVSQYVDSLYDRLHPDIKTDVNILETTNALLNKLSFNQPVAVVDVWGSLIAQKILPKDAIRLSYPDLMKQLNFSQHPMPIFTAILTSRSVTTKEWIEFTPYEISSPYLDSSIPSWSFGRKFENGISSKQGFPMYPPAVALSECIGIWGSAIAVNMNEFIQDKFGAAGTKDILAALKGSAITENRILSEPVFNWNYKLPGAPLSELPKFDLIDAGLDFNVPLPPLLRPERAVDIIIVLDASASTITNPAAQLKLAQEYAQRNNIKFPTIDYDAAKANCSVHFGDAQKNTPTIIYMPVIANSGYQNGWYLDPKVKGNFTSTENFNYSNEQVMQLSGLTEYNVIANKDIITDAVKKVAQQKGALI